MKRTIVGFLVAPVMAPFLFVAVLTFPSILGDVAGFFENRVAVFVIGIPLSHLVALVFGWPLFHLFSRNGLINYWCLSFGGAFVAIVPVILLSLFGPEPVKEIIGSIEVFLLFGVCGFVAGFTYWLIIKPWPSNQSPI